MHHTRRVAIVSLALGALSACGGEPRSPSASGEPRIEGVEVARSALPRASTPSAENVPALGRGNRAFAFELFQEVLKESAGENVVVSPYSVSTALAMTYAGARATTAEEMKRALHFDLPQPALHEAFNAADQALASRGEGKAGADEGTPFRLEVNNSLWAQRGYPVEPSFLDTLAVSYGAGLFLPDFAADHEGARRAINGWVEEKTEKLIPELLPVGSIRPNTVFVLTNTVYFNASWKTKFEKETTRDAPFTRLDGSTVTASMMHGGMRIPYARGEGFQAIALPYASEALSFVAVLPDSGQYEAVEARASQEWLDALREDLASTSVEVGFPKLDYKANTSLKPHLVALGMETAFDDAADFSGMTSQPVAIDDVIHEAVLKVFEGGTIAAAATAVVIRETSAPLFEQRVTLDRPFLFAIVDEPTGQILFLGRVLDPTAK